MKMSTQKYECFYAIFSLLMGISLRLHNIDTVEIREKRSFTESLIWINRI